jgi:hypothetical protein
LAEELWTEGDALRDSHEPAGPLSSDLESLAEDEALREDEPSAMSSGDAEPPEAPDSSEASESSDALEPSGARPVALDNPAPPYPGPPDSESEWDALAGDDAPSSERA